MCSKARNKRCRRYTRIFPQSNNILVILLLLLPLIYSQLLSKNIDKNKYDYEIVYNNNNESVSKSRNKTPNEGSSVLHSIRFHNFEPRSSSEPSVEGFSTNNVIESNIKFMQREKIEKNYTKPQKSISEKRKVRGIHLEADGKELSIDLEITIPFLRFPVQRSIEITKLAFKKFANLNSATLLLGSGFAIGVALFTAFVKTVSSPTFYGYGYNKAMRTAADIMDDINVVSYMTEDDESITRTKYAKKGQELIGSLEQKLYDNNINLTACAQSAICNYFHKTKLVVHEGKGTPTERILDGIANLDLLKAYLNGTAMMNAIDSGRKDDITTCETIYRNCKWTNMQNKAFQIIVEFLNSNFFKLK